MPIDDAQRQKVVTEIRAQFILYVAIEMIYRGAMKV
jgi:hypothetical protein